MIKRIRVAVIVLSSIFGVAPVAHAGFIELIDKLSGPGPFFGATIDARIYCFGIAKSGSLGSLGDEANKACLVNRLSGAPANERPLVTFNMGTGVARSIHNNLPYASNVDTHVWLLSLEPSVWVLPIPQVAIGTSVGVDRFFGHSFNAFYRGYVRPAIEVKPLQFGNGPLNAWRKGLVIRAAVENHADRRRGERLRSHRAIQDESRIAPNGGGRL